MVKYIVTGIILGGLIILAIEYWPKETPKPVEQIDEVEPVVAANPAEQEVEPALVELPVDEPLVEPEPEIELPAYDESDAWLDTELGESLFGLPKADRIARAVAFIASASTGALNKKNWPAFTKFPVVKEGEQYWLDPNGYARFDTWVKRIEAIPPEEMAEIVFTIRPWATQALAQIGDRRTIDDLLRRFCRQIESAPVIPDRIQLVQPNVLYQFRDVGLEQLSDVHKQFLRMGPDHTIRIQSYADAFVRSYDSLIFRQGEVPEGT